MIPDAGSLGSDSRYSNYFAKLFSAVWEHELFIRISSNNDRHTTITNFLVESLLYLYYPNELWKCRYSECVIYLDVGVFYLECFMKELNFYLT